MTINNNTEPFRFCNWNENNLNLLTRTNWRASLVPAAAVIPAPIAYIKVVAVKKLVVEAGSFLFVFPIGTDRQKRAFFCEPCGICLLHGVAGRLL